MSSDLITILSLAIGVLGLVASLVGAYLTYITFVNPIVRFNKYLNNPDGWEKFQGIEDHLSVYRQKKYPNFQIVIDWDEALVENFHEEWINDALYPDKTNNASYYVRMEANAMLLGKEMFVSLDGHRYFVPVPRTKAAAKDERQFYFDTLQIQLARIVGRYHFGKSIEEFAKEQKIPIVYG